MQDKETLETTTSSVEANSNSRKSLKKTSAKKTRTSKSKGRLKRIFLSPKAMYIVIAVVAGFGGGYLGSAYNSRTSDIIPIETKQKIVSSEGELISEIANKVGPSVVSITVTSRATQMNMFGFSGPSEQTGAGTGVIIDSKGTIITNRHVVPQGVTSVNVTLSDGKTFKNVEVIGRTAGSDPLDIAFLRIKDTEGVSLSVAELGNSSDSRVGDRVVAIGNALGQFQNTVTSGILSGHGREVEASDGQSIEELQNLIQTDAAINPGNSGGPLVNLSGEVIGINVAVADANNIGFAIPIDDVKGLIASVNKNGKLERPYLGVRYISLTDDVAYFYNLDVKRGAYIAPSRDGQPSIISGSPADKAELKEKDIIVSIDGVNIDEKNSLISVLGRFSVGDTIDLKILRNGKDKIVKVKLEATPGNDS